MDENTMEIAGCYGIRERLSRLEAELLSVDDVLRLEYDLSGLCDGLKEIIFIVFHDISVERKDYYSSRSTMLENVLSVMQKNGLSRASDRIEDYETGFYIVTNIGESWAA